MENFEISSTPAKRSKRYTITKNLMEDNFKFWLSRPESFDLIKTLIGTCSQKKISLVIS